MTFVVSREAGTFTAINGPWVTTWEFVDDDTIDRDSGGGGDPADFECMEDDILVLDVGWWARPQRDLERAFATAHESDDWQDVSL